MSTTPDKFPNIFVAVLARSLALGGSETEVYLSTITTLDGQVLQTSDISYLPKIVLSVDVQSASRAEFISGTGFSSGDVAVTGCTRGLSFTSNTVIPANKKFHAVGAPVIIAWGTQNLIDLEQIIIDNYAAIEAQIAALSGIYLALDGSNHPSANISWNSHKITNLLDPTNPQDAATKIYVDESIAAGAPPATTVQPGIILVATQADYDNTTDTTTISAVTYYNMATISQIKNGSYLTSKKFTAGVSFTGATTPQVVVWGDGSNSVFSSVTNPTGADIQGNGGIAAVAVEITNIETNMIISGVSCIVVTFGTPTDHMKVSLRADNAGAPSASIITSAIFDPTGGYQQVNFGAATQLIAGSSYWIVYERTGGLDLSNYYRIGCVDGGIGQPELAQSSNGTTWIISSILPSGGIYVQFVANSVFPATSSTNLYQYGDGSVVQPTPSFLNYVGGFVNTTITKGSLILVISDGYLLGFTGLTISDDYYLQDDSTLGVSGTLKAGRAIETTEILINRAS